MHSIKKKLLRPCNLPYICLYCGEPATDKEHVVPKSLVGDRTHIVWSCSECNTLAGTSVFESIQEKTDYIHERIRKGYAKILKMPDWSQDELDELDGKLKSEVKGAVARKLWIKNRLEWKTSLDVLIAVKFLEESAIGNVSVAKSAEIISTLKKEQKLFFSLEQDV